MGTPARSTSRGGSMSSSARRLLLSVALVATGLMGTASNASAVTPKMTSDGSVRDCVRMTLKEGCASRGTVKAGTVVKMHCYRDDSWATGEYRSDRWFYITASSGKKGYVHSSRVNPQAEVPECSTKRGIIASTWAAQHVGIAKTTPKERAAMGESTLYWAGYCAGFTFTATKRGSGRTLRYYGAEIDARKRYQLYKKARLVTTSGTPNVGAHVFWPNVSDLGHTAIYLGNNAVATTRGWMRDTSANKRVSMTKTPEYGRPAGWVNPGNL